VNSKRGNFNAVLILIGINTYVQQILVQYSVVSLSLSGHRVLDWVSEISGDAKALLD